MKKDFENKSPFLSQLAEGGIHKFKFVLSLYFSKHPCHPNIFQSIMGIAHYRYSGYFFLIVISLSNQEHYKACVCYDILHVELKALLTQI